MSVKTHGSSSPQHIETLNMKTEQPPPAINDSSFLQIEIESGNRTFSTHSITNTNWAYSVVTAVLVSNLNLRRIPMTPPLRQRPFQTPVGLRYLKDYVPMWIRAPWLGIRHEICISIGVVGLEDSGRDAALYVGVNLWNKIAAAAQGHSQMESLNLVASQQLEPDRHLTALLPKIIEEMPRSRESSTTPNFAGAAGPMSVRCPQEQQQQSPRIAGADGVDPDRSTDTDRDTDPSRLTRHGPEDRSRSATLSRLDSSSPSTNHLTSTAPSTQDLYKSCTHSHDTVAARDELQLVTNNHGIDDDLRAVELIQDTKLPPDTTNASPLMEKAASNKNRPCSSPNVA